MYKLIGTTILLALAPNCHALVPPGLHHGVTAVDPSHFMSVMQHTGMVATNKVATTYTDLLIQHPLMTKMATGGILATCGDAIAQSQTPEPYDKRRAASFMLFDMAYRSVQHVCFPIIVHGCQGQYLQGLLTNLHLSSLVNLPTEYAAVAEQTLASQLGIVPFWYYPVFFTLTAFIQGLSAEGAVERAKENFVPLMKRNLLFWLPVQFVQFGFIDENLQIPFLSVAGLCWTFILSLAAGSATTYNKTNVADYSSPDKNTDGSDDSFPQRALPAASSSST